MNPCESFPGDEASSHTIYYKDMVVFNLKCGCKCVIERLEEEVENNIDNMTYVCRKHSDLRTLSWSTKMHEKMRQQSKIAIQLIKDNFGLD